MLMDALGFGNGVGGEVGLALREESWLRDAELFRLLNNLVSHATPGMIHVSTGQRDPE